MPTIVGMMTHKASRPRPRWDTLTRVMIIWVVVMILDGLALLAFRPVAGSVPVGLGILVGAPLMYWQFKKLVVSRKLEGFRIMHFIG